MFSFEINLVSKHFVESFKFHALHSFNLVSDSTEVARVALVSRENFAMKNVLCGRMGVIVDAYVNAAKNHQSVVAV